MHSDVYCFHVGSGASRLDSQPIRSSSSSSQTQLSQWPWRDEFKSHISKISMALSESIKQSCEKALDEELQSYNTSKRIPAVKLRGLDVILHYCYKMVLTTNFILDFIPDLA